MASHECKVGNEVEITYRLEYKMAEVSRLPDAASFSHVTTSIGSTPDVTPPAEFTATFSNVREHTKVSQDDQQVTFVTRVKQLPAGEEMFAVPVVAYFSDGKQIAAGEKPVEIAQLVVKKG